MYGGHTLSSHQYARGGGASANALGADMYTSSPGLTRATDAHAVVPGFGPAATSNTGYVERPNFSQPTSHRGAMAHPAYDQPPHSTASFRNSQAPYNTPGGAPYGATTRETSPPAPPPPLHPGAATDGTTAHRIETLSGQSVRADEFTHNNMVPFFGSNVKQNLDPHSNASIVALHTGMPATDKRKEECNAFFSPEKAMGHVNGTPNLPETLRNIRYNASNFRQGEKPAYEERVGPGLNQGYTAKPSGGFQQMDARDYALPKTVDELRVATNPKITYTAPAIPGTATVTNRGKSGVVSKNNPDRFYVNSPARYNTTVGAVKGKRLRSKPVDRRTNRQFTTREHTGGAGRRDNLREETRGTCYVRAVEPFKNETPLESDGVRNATGGERWGDTEAFTGTYGKAGIEVLPNERDTTQLTHYLSNAVSVVKELIAPIEDLMRTTRKENAIGNPRISGNMGYPVKKATVYDPNDVARTTIKETNVHDNRTGQVGGHVRRAIPVYDPNDVARTTIKETNVHDTRTGHVGTSTRRAGAVYDPNDVARVTIKETNVHDNRTGHVGTSTRRAGTVYDPNDVTRTTVKETNIHDVRTGQMGADTRRAGAVYDPNDLARTTIKETNIHDNRTGQIAGDTRRAGAVYDPNDLARTTVKETNIHDNRTGNVHMTVTKVPVYDPNDIAKTTIKETNIHDTRTGPMSTQPSGDGQGAHQQGVVLPSDVAKTTVRETTDQEATTVNLAGPTRPTVHDPADVARTTIKETNIDNERQGNIGGLDTKGGYATNPKTAPNTNRQFTADNERVGLADGQDQGGYQVAGVQAPRTQKENLNDDGEYTGTAAGQDKAPMSYADAYNATTDEVKEVVAEGRQPTLTGAKAIPDKSLVCMEQRSDHDRANQRELATTRVLESLPPDQSACSVTKDKMNLAVEPERNQPDPALVEAFEGNPYTQRLDSSA